MKVKELIEQLNRLDPEIQIFHYDGDSGDMTEPFLDEVKVAVPGAYPYRTHVVYDWERNAGDAVPAARIY